MKNNIIEAGSGKRKKHPKSIRALYPMLQSVFKNQHAYQKRIENYNSDIINNLDIYKNLESHIGEINETGTTLNKSKISLHSCFIIQPILEKYNFVRLDRLVEKFFKGAKFIVNRKFNSDQYLIVPPESYRDIEMLILELPNVGNRIVDNQWVLFDDKTKHVLSIIKKQKKYEKGKPRNVVVIPLDPKDPRNPQKADFQRAFQKKGFCDGFYAHILLAQVEPDKNQVNYIYLDSCFSHRGFEKRFNIYMKNYGGLLHDVF